MLVVELSALSNPELHRLLAAARSRDQSSLAVELESEINMRAGSAARAYPAERSRARAWPMAGLAAAGMLATFMGWTLTHPNAAPAPQAPTSLQLAVRDAPEPVSIALRPLIADRPARPATEAAAPSSTGDQPATAPRPNPCLDEPTPADRLVCGYPSLAAKHRRLREAYLQALAAGASPDELDAGQAEWSDTRGPIADRKRLAEAYSIRIRELEAATDAAQMAEPTV